MVGPGRAPDARHVPPVVVELGLGPAPDSADLAAGAEHVAHLAALHLHRQEVAVPASVVQDQAVLLRSLEVELYEQDGMRGVDLGQLHPGARRLKRQRILVRQVEAVEGYRAVDRVQELVVGDQLEVGAAVDDQLLQLTLERIQVSLRERTVLVLGELGAHVERAVGEHSVGLVRVEKVYGLEK